WFHPAGLDVLKRYPVNPWGTVVGLGHPIGFPEGLHFADMDIQAPEPPGRFSLRLHIYPPLQVLQTDGRCCHVAPASHSSENPQTVGPFCPPAIPPFPHSSGPFPPPLIFSRFPGVAVYTTSLAPPVSRWDEEGFSSGSACPCAHAVAPPPP